MLFHTLQFWIFFFIVLLLFYRLPFRWGKIVLLAGSYFFYTEWDARFTALIFASTVLDYTLGLLIARATDRYRKLLLVVSICGNLGILGFFKYYNFFEASLAQLLGISPDTLALKIILPVGISFYTFKSMSYTIDVYRGWLRPVTHFLDYALFVAFFPELVAGPIVRADVFFPQLFNWQRPSTSDVMDAINLILWGLVKKMVFADRFALIADTYFSSIATHPGPVAAWTGTLAFAMQIYFDFSGYTDIARGCALLLGIRFPLNFLRPYLSQNIAEFWRRWHMSLSTWLRDYLYISLGGNRKGAINTYRNLMLTMLLGGLWHGANWTFVLWGTYHGLLLVLHRLFMWTTSRAHISGPLAAPALAPAKILITLFFVLISWVLFRATSIGDAALVIQAMFSGPWLWTTSVLTSTSIALIAVATIVAILEERFGLLSRMYRARTWYRVASYVVLLFALEVLAVRGQQIPFIYFQF
jgi:D-alanyl-lipoteichoic acid acyltransferase DltB (MBOAT superfamily)